MSDLRRVFHRQNADIRNNQQSLLCLRICRRLSVVSLNRSRTTLRRTVKQLLESICIVKFSKNQIDVIFA